MHTALKRALLRRGLETITATVMTVDMSTHVLIPRPLKLMQ
jgi:hypothetical protein